MQQAINPIRRDPGVSRDTSELRLAGEQRRHRIFDDALDLLCRQPPTSTAFALAPRHVVAIPATPFDGLTECQRQAGLVEELAPGRGPLPSTADLT
jgi:hypothetical protein